MAYEIVIPRLGLTMETGRLVEWHKHEGDRVKQGELLFAIETDKAVQDVEAPAAGIVHPKPGVVDQLLPIGTLIGYIATPGENISWQDQPVMPSPKPAPTAPAEGAMGETTARRNGKTRASPSARRRAGELGIDWHLLPGSSPEGYVLRADVERAANDKKSTPIPPVIPAPVGRSPVVESSPVARRLAAQAGIDLVALAATLGRKRIMKEDVASAIAAAIAARAAAPPPLALPAPSVPLPAPAALPQATTELRSPVSAVRRLIAERMLASHLQTARVTLTAHADATELYRLREALKGDSASALPIPSYTDLLIKILAHALVEHPLLNARLEGDAVIQPGQINIGIAVDTERGLLVPVVREVAHKGLRQLAAKTSELAEAARSGKIQPDDLHGGTFTLTNLGMYDIDAFTPLINSPECAILGVGRIAPQPVVVDAAAEKIAVRQMMTLSLTFDHRLVDGGPAARFLQRVKQLIEQPYVWLVA